MSSVSRLGLPTKRRSYKFALTPLADAMFQLLIFFMLSSSLIPYSLLTLQSASPAVDDAGANPGDISEPTADTTSSGPPTDTAMWTIDNKAVIVGGQPFSFEDLGNLAAALGTASAPADVILVIRAEAQMQDITTVLEALQKASVGSVQITSGGN